MRKLTFLLVSLFFCSIATTVFAENFPDYFACRKALQSYAIQADNQSLSDLSSWFASFAQDDEGQGDSKELTLIGGCNLFLWNDDLQKPLWVKFQQKLDAQVARLTSHQNSLYGAKASLTCKRNPNTHRIVVDSCI